MEEFIEMLTLEEQKNRLLSRGLIVDSEEELVKFLSNRTYHAISQYLKDFKTDSGMYIEGTSFRQIEKIIEFDGILRSILLYTIEIAESTLKAKVSYHFSTKYSPYDYLNASSPAFQDKKTHRDFLKHFYQSLANYEDLPYYKRQTIKYEKKVPFWVAVETFTLGNIRHFYGNLRQEDQEEIAQQFNMDTLQLENWIAYIRFIRNLVAHNRKIYNCKMSKIPCSFNAKEVFVPSHMIFDCLYVLKYLIQDVQEWNQLIVRRIKNLIDEYEGLIEIDKIGFPENWLEQMTNR